jgi:hypothetical protein
MTRRRRRVNADLLDRFRSVANGHDRSIIGQDLAKLTSAIADTPRCG